MAKIVKQENIDGVMVYTLQRELSSKYVHDNIRQHKIEEHPELVIDHSADGYDAATGELLFRFRKDEMPEEILMAGVDNYRHSITVSGLRGDAAGGTTERLDKDGNPTGIFMAEDTTSGNVGFMNGGGMQPYCRLTAFGREHYETYFKDGRPFVDYIDAKYKELCPDHHKRQLKTANETNANYVLWDTAFSTITVNQNFRTAVHQDAGDHPEGFGNLFVYREGEWTGGYFTLPEWGVGVDMQNKDMLFVDVHRFHGNSPWTLDEDNGEDLRISFVLYYRTGLRKCLGPTEQLKKLKHKKSSYHRI